MFLVFKWLSIVETLTHDIARPPPPRICAVENSDLGGGGEPPETEVVAKRRGGAGVVDRWFNVGGGAPTIELGLGVWED
jgi:hypothetical protein